MLEKRSANFVCSDTRWGAVFERNASNKIQESTKVIGSEVILVKSNRRNMPPGTHLFCFAPHVHLRRRRSTTHHSSDSSAEAKQTEQTILRPAIKVNPLGHVILTSGTLFSQRKASTDPVRIQFYRFRIVDISIGLLERQTSSENGVETWSKVYEFTGQEVLSRRIRYIANVLQPEKLQPSLKDTIILKVIHLTNTREEVILVLPVNFVRIELTLSRNEPLTIFQVHRVSVAAVPRENCITQWNLKAESIPAQSPQNMYYTITKDTRGLFESVTDQQVPLNLLMLEQMIKGIPPIGSPFTETFHIRIQSDKYTPPQIALRVQDGRLIVKAPKGFVPPQSHLYLSCPQSQSSGDSSGGYFIEQRSGTLLATIMVSPTSRQVAHNVDVSAEAISIRVVQAPISGCLLFDDHAVDEFDYSAILRYRITYWQCKSLHDRMVPCRGKLAMVVSRFRVDNVQIFSASDLIEGRVYFIPSTRCKNETDGDLNLLQQLINSRGSTQEQPLTIRVSVSRERHTISFRNLTIGIGEKVPLKKTNLHISEMDDEGRKSPILRCGTFSNETVSESTTDGLLYDEIFVIEEPPTCGSVYSKRLNRTVGMFSLKNIKDDDVYFQHNGKETCIFPSITLSALIRGSVETRVPRQMMVFFVLMKGMPVHLIRLRSPQMWWNSVVEISTLYLAAQKTTMADEQEITDHMQIQYKVGNTHGGVLSSSVNEKAPIRAFGNQDLRQGSVAFHHDAH
ncbi:hypothetical protein TcWFU_002377 [Taenia crassiceps]|uniref:Uncharacterized protein n=1 Tax=Taenia crassiceps TaxID=6207 RepID=A0ABR4QQ28_9CEST